jgi:hypothetical protein
VSVPDPRSAACRYCHATDRACSTLWLLDPPGRTYVTWVQAHHALGEPTIIYGAPSDYDSSRQPVRMLRSGVA